MEEVNTDCEDQRAPAPEDGKHVKVTEPGLRNFDKLHQFVGLLLACMFTITECLLDRGWQVSLN